MTLDVYAQLVDKAAQQPVPQNPTLKTKDQFRYMGKLMHRRDTPLKVNGAAIYGMDVKVPGMLIASIERCPVFGGKVKSFDATATKRIRGVKHVVQVSNGVAVVGDSFWTVTRGRKALKVEWDEGANATASSAASMQATDLRLNSTCSRTCQSRARATVFLMNCTSEFIGPPRHAGNPYP